MSAQTFAQLWPSCVILILLFHDLAFPFGPLRRWLLAGPHIAASSDQGPFLIEGDKDRVGPYATHREAAGKLTFPERLRSVAGDWIGCVWCIGAHVTFWSVLIFCDGNVWDRVCWFGALWLASSGTCVVLDAIAEA